MTLSAVNSMLTSQKWEMDQQFDQIFYILDCQVKEGVIKEHTLFFTISIAIFLKRFAGPQDHLCC